MNGQDYQEHRQRLAERRRKIKELYDSKGLKTHRSYADVAKLVSEIEGKDISRERIFQIVKGYERKPRRKA